MFMHIKERANKEFQILQERNNEVNHLFPMAHGKQWHDNVKPAWEWQLNSRIENIVCTEFEIKPQNDETENREQTSFWVGLEQYRAPGSVPK